MDVPRIRRRNGRGLPVCGGGVVLVGHTREDNVTTIKQQWRQFDARTRYDMAHGEADRDTVDDWSAVCLGEPDYLRMAGKCRRRIARERRRGEWACTGTIEANWFSWHQLMRQARRARGA